MVKSRVLRTAEIVFIVGSIASVRSAQMPTSPAFEVASIKSNKSGPGSIQRAGLQPGDRVTMTNVTLRILIQLAYPGPSDIIGGPSWVGSGRRPQCRLVQARSRV
jgi:hypothetical protein